MPAIELSKLETFPSIPTWFVKTPSSYSSCLSFALKVGDGVTSGLEANGDEFRVNGKDLKILSGSLHYFR